MQRVTLLFSFLALLFSKLLNKLRINQIEEQANARGKLERVFVLEKFSRKSSDVTTSWLRHKLRSREGAGDGAQRRWVPRKRRRFLSYAVPCLKNPVSHHK